MVPIGSLQQGTYWKFKDVYAGQVLHVGIGSVNTVFYRLPEGKREVRPCALGFEVTAISEKEFKKLTGDGGKKKRRRRRKKEEIEAELADKYKEKKKRRTARRN